MLFKDKLIELREAAGMTQEALAVAADVPLPSLRKYEQGKRGRVTLSVAAKLSKALGTDCRAFAECDDVSGDEEVREEAEAKSPKPRIGRPKKGHKG